MIYLKKEAQCVSVGQKEMKIHIKIYFQSNLSFYISVNLRAWDFESIVTEFLTWGVQSTEMIFLDINMFSYFGWIEAKIQINIIYKLLPDFSDKNCISFTTSQNFVNFRGKINFEY